MKRAFIPTWGLILIITTSVLSCSTNEDYTVADVESETLSPIQLNSAADGSGTDFKTETIIAGNSLTIYGLVQDEEGGTTPSSGSTWSIEGSIGYLTVAEDGTSAVFSAFDNIGDGKIRVKKGNYIGEVSITILEGPVQPLQSPNKFYSEGPLLPSTNLLQLTEYERTAFTMIDALMQTMQGVIEAEGCIESNYPAVILSNDSGAHSTSFGPSGSEVVLNATVFPENFRGQHISIAQSGSGDLNGTLVSNLASSNLFIKANHMASSSISVDITNIATTLFSFTGQFSKNYYLDESTSQPYILDWGQSNLLLADYPTAKYWQRSKVKPSSTESGRSVFVADRIVGNSKCRITLDVKGDNSATLFSQSGTISIQQLVPTDVVPEFDIDF